MKGYHRSNGGNTANALKHLVDALISLCERYPGIGYLFRMGYDNHTVRRLKAHNEHTRPAVQAHDFRFENFILVIAPARFLILIRARCGGSRDVLALAVHLSGALALALAHGRYLFRHFRWKLAHV